MKKRDKIIYWVATVWLCLGMMSSAIVQLLQLEEEIAFILDLGYPKYFLTIIGVAKILGVIAVLIPKFPLVKEWAYAGFFFLMAGAAISHVLAGTTNEIFGSLLLLTLTIISWYFRLPGRKLNLHRE